MSAGDSAGAPPSGMIMGAASAGRGAGTTGGPRKDVAGGRDGGTYAGSVARVGAGPTLLLLLLLLLLMLGAGSATDEAAGIVADPAAVAADAARSNRTRSRSHSREWCSGARATRLGAAGVPEPSKLLRSPLVASSSSTASKVDSVNLRECQIPVPGEA